MDDFETFKRKRTDEMNAVWQAELARTKWHKEYQDYVDSCAEPPETIEWIISATSGNPYYRGSINCTVFPDKHKPGRWTFLFSKDNEDPKYVHEFYPTREEAQSAAQEQLMIRLSSLPALSDLRRLRPHNLMRPLGTRDGLL